ncbi:hypothetical protein [Wolbachia endosymbiont (group E) of Neria commutata]|uniref:hypothetical protein n=1 Tax=Wolbachia endosymbiont (group E) of Neria commutata TaxID=3066149 RepID=UPI0031333C48
MWVTISTRCYGGWNLTITISRHRNRTKKVLTGIGEAGAPGLVTGVDELTSRFSGKSSEEKKSVLETTSEELIDLAIRSAEKAKAGAEKIDEGLLKNDLGEMLEGAKRLENTHGEIVVKDVINSSKGEFKTLIEALNRSSRTAGQGEDIEKAIQKGDVKGLFEGIKSLDKVSPFMHDLALEATKKVFVKMVERLNEFSDELTNIASKLEKDIREGDNLDKIIKGIEELKQIDPEDTKLMNDQHSPTSEDDIELHSEFIFF